MDDEAPFLFSVEMVFKTSGLGPVHTLQCGGAVSEKLKNDPPQAILLDLGLPDISGMDLLGEMTLKYPDLPVLIITGDNELDQAIACIKAGAFDYLVKPISRDRLLTSVQRALEWRVLKQENSFLQKSISEKKISVPKQFQAMITQTPAMLSLFSYIEAIAPFSSSVLITGETGTGKELVAKALHQLSGRSGKFVTVNAAGLDDAVFSDTLFGHKKGAFTGALENRSGLIQEASEGTIFLDEIGDLPPASQVKLLRLLQEGEYLPLGSDQLKRSTARIVAATNQDLEALQKKNIFRKDLFFRLGAHQMYLPPLRERKEDIPLLVTAFIEEGAKLLKKNVPSVSSELFTLLSTYPFPGNIRELKSMVLDALGVHKSGTLSLEVFKKNIRHMSSPLDTYSPKPYQTFSFPPMLPTLKECEELLVDEALSRAKGNQSIASNLLGISRQALNKRLRIRKQKN